MTKEQDAFATKRKELAHEMQGTLDLAGEARSMRVREVELEKALRT